MRDLTDALREEIKRSNLTMYRISLMSGIDISVISRFVRGKRDITLVTASKIAEVLDLKLKVYL